MLQFQVVFDLGSDLVKILEREIGLDGVKSENVEEGHVDSEFVGMNMNGSYLSDRDLRDTCWNTQNFSYLWSFRLWKASIAMK